jgi:glyoxylase-like metal-dependent hydrolase (beta-lactamase superfamily II)
MTKSTCWMCGVLLPITVAWALALPAQARAQSPAQHGATEAPAVPPNAPAGPLWASYARAADLLRLSLEAHGGAAAIRGVEAITFGWHGDDFAPTQGRMPAWDTAGNRRAALQTLRADLQRGRFVVEREFHFGGGYVNAIHQAGEGPDLVSWNPLRGRGMGGTVFTGDGGGVAARRTLHGAAANMPLLLLRTAQLRAASIRHLGEHVREGRREYVIAFTTADADPVTLYIDAGTHLVSAREEMGQGSLGDEVNTYVFTDYRRENGLMVPYAMEVRWNGLLASRRTLTEFALAAALPDTLLAPPEGYVRAEAPPPPAVVKVAEGVFFLENLAGGYRMLVVDTPDGVLVVDAPVSRAMTESALAMAEQALPGRPVRYAVITHHHSDHIAGIPALAARGVTLLAAEGSAEYLRRMSTVPRTFGAIAGTPAPLAPDSIYIENVQGTRRFGSGASEVHVLNVGPTSHAAAMLVVYLPQQRLLFQGDLLRVNEHGGPVVALDAARDLHRIIQQFRLDVHTIGAVHGINATPAQLQEVLRQ